MSPSAAREAEKIGYTNVKVYHEGTPVWTKKNYLVVTPQSYKEAFVDKDISHVVIDLRPAVEFAKGFIKGAVAVLPDQIDVVLADFPDKKLNPPVIVYDAAGGKAADQVARKIIAAGYPSAKVMTGGFTAWVAANFTLEQGKPATKVVYVLKPRPGEISIEEFQKLAAAPGNGLILDVRTSEEIQSGVIKNSKHIPTEEVVDRLAELPKDKPIAIHCSTGTRAEMTYNILKEKGFNVKYLNANIKVAEDGKFEITK